MTIAGNTVLGIGYSNDVAGGFAQYMPVAERLLLEVPNGLPAAHAARTEPIDHGRVNGGKRREAPAADSRLAGEAQIRSLRSNPLRLGMQPSLTLYWL